MGTKKQRVQKWEGKLAVWVLSIIAVLWMFSAISFAADGKNEVAGKMYEFDKDSHYEFNESGTTYLSESDERYGTFFVNGSVVTVSEQNGVPAYEVYDGNLDIFYDYSDDLLNADEDSWHLVEDKSKKVADMSLESNILKGGIIIQTSRDRKNWVDIATICNAFSDVPIRTDAIYSTTDVQLINGCYYRVIVVYELSVRTEDSKFLFISTDKYDYKKCAEVYEFYAYTDSGDDNVIDMSQTFSLGTRVRVEDFDGYIGEELIEKDDLHYGWELGNFFVSGYTDEVETTDGEMVFLKNVGDKVTLWFNLNQNIDALNGDEKLSITADTEGYDQYFETPKMDFGRGVLIIRYTDYNNVKAEPTIYTDYLEANATLGADTKVQLFEEGDYEIALDYEVTRDELIDKIAHYRIFFKFSVRNSNCMVYPFDVATGTELTNSSMTENGFRLDLANSRYLKINIKRETLKDSADGLVEDTRFNGSAKDGAEYTDEGIYTITVTNQYTGVFTTKKIYVGTNSILRAYMTTGLSIAEINNLIAEGATISEDGTIQIPVVEPVEEVVEEQALSTETEASVSPLSEDSAGSEGELVAVDEAVESEQFPVAILIGAVAGVVVAIVVIAVCAGKKKRRKMATEIEDCSEQGGVER